MKRLAQGTERVSLKRRSFKVCIRYREPDYERRTRPRDQPFRFTFAVQSVDEADAVAQALARFKEAQRLSSVGWSREIVGVEVNPDVS